MPLTITQVDAFTSEPFAGNPAGVCLLTAPRDDAWMQNVAAEMNLAETAFLLHRPDGYGLRWFTPVAEVDLCDHATLASAHVLWERGARAEEGLDRARLPREAGRADRGAAGLAASWRISGRATEEILPARDKTCTLELPLIPLLAAILETL
jgi:predicted PhzF superfamily epimerase YddE/YHI9